MDRLVVHEDLGIRVERIRRFSDKYFSRTRTIMYRFQGQEDLCTGSKDKKIYVQVPRTRRIMYRFQEQEELCTGSKNKKNYVQVPRTRRSMSLGNSDLCGGC